MISSFKPNFQRAFDFSKINFKPYESRWYPNMKAARAGYRVKYPPSPEPSDIGGASIIASDVSLTLLEVSTLTTVPTFNLDLSKKV